MALGKLDKENLRMSQKKYKRPACWIGEVLTTVTQFYNTLLIDPLKFSQGCLYLSDNTIWSNWRYIIWRNTYAEDNWPSGTLFVHCSINDLRSSSIPGMSPLGSEKSASIWMWTRPMNRGNLFKYRSTEVIQQNSTYKTRRKWIMCLQRQRIDKRDVIWL